MSSPSSSDNFRESKTWVTMNTTLSNTYDPKLIISTAPSVSPKLPENYRFINNYIQGLEEFIKNNNKSVSNNISLFTSKMIQLFKDNKIIFFENIIDEQKEIKSFSLAMCVPIYIQNLDTSVIKFEEDYYSDFIVPQKSVLFGYVNYMCVHTDERDHALGLSTVQGILNFGYPKGVWFGYYIVDIPKTKASMVLQPWYRIINYNNAKNIGYSIKDNKQKDDKDDIRTRLYYSIKIPNNYKIVNCISNDLEEYYKLIINKTFVYYPSQKHWDLYITTFKTFKIIENNKIIGMYSLFNTNVYISKTNKISNVCNLLWCLGTEMLEILKCVFSTAQSFKSDICNGFILGDVDLNSVNENKTILVKQMYLEFYNTNVKREHSEINIPIY